MKNTVAAEPTMLEEDAHAGGECRQPGEIRGLRLHDSQAEGAGRLRRLESSRDNRRIAVDRSPLYQLAPDVDSPEPTHPPHDTAPVDDSAAVRPDEPAAWTLAVVAAGLSAIAGIATFALWMARVPPRPSSRTAPIVGTIALVAVAGLVVGCRRVRLAGRRFAALAAATVWSCLLVGWTLVFPGTDSTLGVLIGGIVAVVTFIALLMLFGARFSGWPLDTTAGSLVAVATITAVVAAWSPLTDYGLRLRLSMVEDRYERAIDDGDVVATGGFIDGDLVGWVWIESWDESAAMVFDASDSLDQRTRAEPMSMQALDALMTCERVERTWFWCRVVDR